jgi:hypothetical protein
MKRIGTFRLALWSGMLAEIIACVSFALCLGYDSSTPSHASSEFISFIWMFHMPGIWLFRYILPLVLLSGAMQFVILFWAGISLWRTLHGRNTPA